MADFLSSDERAAWAADADMIFDTMSAGRTVTIVKEPNKIQIDQPPSINNQFGFGESQTDPIYNYIPESQAFPVVVIYGKDQKSILVSEVNQVLPNGAISIKVKRNCYDYFQEGRIQHFIIDERKFVINGEPYRQMFLNSEYFILPLLATK